MKPIIGITAGDMSLPQPKWIEFTHAQGAEYVAAVEDSGGAPCIIPLIKDKAALRKIYDQLDGILLAGGIDIDPRLFNQEPYPQTKLYSPARDANDIQLIEWALQDDKPMLGICRGLQLLNVVRGGTLYQHIPTDLPDAGDHEGESYEHLAHTLKIAEDSKLYEVLHSNTIRANTRHHQAIHNLGTNIRPTAWAQDGIIEAIELTDHPYAIAVQPHPESLYARAEPKWQRLFESFITAAQPQSVTATKFTFTPKA